MQYPSPRVAVVIPAYKQPGLLGEAIACVLAQDPAARAVAIVVDDGCPWRETRDVALCFARAHPGRVFGLRRANGGLSAARNLGIDFALKGWPELEAVAFLDADNRFHKAYLSRVLAALASAPAEIGWIYPDIDKFGIAGNCAMSGDFSFLHLLDANYCEAGSVVRRALLATGLRFDESLKDGFEDWDFWLQAAQAGFRGRHLPNSGFQYRHRGASMLSEASGRRDVIVAEMNRKRKALLRPRNLMKLEIRETQRYAIFHPDEGWARFTHDPALSGRALELAEAARRLRAFQAAPMANDAPAFLWFVSRRALAMLADALVLASLAWLAQRLMREKRAVQIFLTFSADSQVRVGLRGSVVAPRPGDQPILVVMRSADLTTEPEDFLRRLEMGPDSIAAESAVVDLELPIHLARGDADIGDGAGIAMRDLAEALAVRPKAAPPGWRRDNRAVRNDLIGLYERICGVGALPPLSRPPDSRGEIGFLVPVHSFGGVEKVVGNQARVLRALGFRTHLFVSGATSFLLTPETRESFCSVNPLFCADFEAAAPTGGSYLGASTSAFEWKGDKNDVRDVRDVLGLLCTMDAIVNSHSLGGNGIASQLREYGVLMMTALHMVEPDKWGAPIGNPHTALAYEHAFERFLVISKRLRDWCAAHGVPESKILHLPNAPGYVHRTAPKSLQERRTSPPEPLKVLFLGRLDPQKGLDRLKKVMAATRDERFQWRVIGGVVLGDPQAAADLGAPVEAPLHDSSELDAAFDWADVLVLPSRYEGAPLTILEAKRRGVVTIAANVGAVAEVVAPGDILIDPTGGEAQIVADFVASLTRLAADRKGLSQRTKAALESPAMSWEQSIAPLVAFLEEAIEQPPFTTVEFWTDPNRT